MLPALKLQQRPSPSGRPGKLVPQTSASNALRSHCKANSRCSPRLRLRQLACERGAGESRIAMIMHPLSKLSPTAEIRDYGGVLRDFFLDLNFHCYAIAAAG